MIEQRVNINNNMNINIVSGRLSDLTVSPECTPPPMSLNVRRKSRKRRHIVNEQEMKRNSSVDQFPFELVDQFNIQSESIMVHALRLEYPEIMFRGQYGNVKQRVNQLKWGGRNGTAGFLGDVHILHNWVIVGNHGANWAAHKVFSHWETYCSMRGFWRLDENPIQEPSIKMIDIFHEQSYMELLNENAWEMILLILPDGEQGSKIKSIFTKFVCSKKIICKHMYHVYCYYMYIYFFRFKANKFWVQMEGGV